VKTLADCLRKAGVKSPVDMERIRTALQSYNPAASQYPASVLHYYPYGQFSYGVGDEAIVKAAAAQIGNRGGRHYIL